MNSVTFKRAFKNDILSLKIEADNLLRDLQFLSTFDMAGKYDRKLANHYDELKSSILDNIQVRDQIIQLLQMQIGVMSNERNAIDPYDILILPGQIIQNDTRVNWEVLRISFSIVLDLPVTTYHQQINQLLDRPANPEIDPETTFSQLIDDLQNPSETIYPGEQMDRTLTTHGLCRHLPLNILKAKFYWPWFCSIDLDTLRLSTRLYNCLKKSSHNTIGDVIIESEETLSSVRDFGRGSMKELTYLLDAMGLKLNMKQSDFKMLYCV